MIRAFSVARFAYSVLFLLFLFTVVAPLAYANEIPPDSRSLFLPQSQLLVAIVGSLVPIFTYALNYRAGWVSEPVKAMVLALVSAAAGAIALLIDSGGLSLDWETAQLVLTAVVMAFLSHLGFWRPSGISTNLGGGRNKQEEPAA